MNLVGQTEKGTFTIVTPVRGRENHRLTEAGLQYVL